MKDEKLTDLFRGNRHKLATLFLAGVAYFLIGVLAVGLKVGRN